MNNKNIAALRRKRHIRNKLSGTAQRPRLSVFRSSRHIYAQVIDDIAGATLASASTRSKALRDQIAYGGNIKAAAVVGDSAAGAAIATATVGAPLAAAGALVGGVAGLIVGVPFLPAGLVAGPIAGAAIGAAATAAPFTALGAGIGAGVGLARGLAEPPHR